MFVCKVVERKCKSIKKILLIVNQMARIKVYLQHVFRYLWYIQQGATMNYAAPSEGP